MIHFIITKEYCVRLLVYLLWCVHGSKTYGNSSAKKEKKKTRLLFGLLRGQRELPLVVGDGLGVRGRGLLSIRFDLLPVLFADLELRLKMP